MQSHTKESNAQAGEKAEKVEEVPEASATQLTDPRLVYRLERIVECMSNAPGQSIPQISTYTAEAKAAYRFLGFLG